MQFNIIDKEEIKVMENKLQIFSNEQFGQVRTAEFNNKIYFCGKDVATALGYSDTAKAIRSHCKGVDEIATPTNGGIQLLKFITEGDLYRLITHSKLPSAEQFECWVFDEVLPTIRKTGMYATDELLDNPDLAIKAFTALKEERERTKALTEKIAVQEQQIAELKPKASYYDLVLNCKDLLSISEIAKDYGKSAKWFNKYLHDAGVQYKQGNKIWLLYQKYADKGYTSTKTHILNGTDGKVHLKTHTYWTQKGRLFLYDLLKRDGILPLIEKISA